MIVLSCGNRRSVLPEFAIFIFAGIRRSSALLVIVATACGDTGIAPSVSPPTAVPPPAPEPEPELSAPTGLHVLATGADYIEWRWNPVEGAAGFEVQFSLNEAFTDQDEIVVLTLNSHTYHRDDLPLGTAAYLRVRAAKGPGDAKVRSAWSAHVGGTTLDVIPVPTGLHVSSTGCGYSDFDEAYYYGVEWSWDPVEVAAYYEWQVSYRDTEPPVFDPRLFRSNDTSMGARRCWRSTRNWPTPVGPRS